MKLIFRQKYIIMLLSCVASMSAYSQKYSFGVGAGSHIGFLHYSNLDKDYYPTTKPNPSYLFSIYGQVEFGKNESFAIRPQISFLRRGGKVNGPSKKIILTRRFYEDEVLVDERIIKELNYSLNPNFIDIRIPLMYQFLKSNSRIRPYVYVAPVFGFTTGGNINLETAYKGHLHTDNTETEISKSNMRAFNFSAQIGAGAKYAIPIAGNTFYAGLEVNYELGLTDTYSKSEKIAGRKSSSKPRNIYNNTKSYEISGCRRMNGLEIQATFTVPLSVFKKKAKPAKVEVIESTPIVPIIEVAEKEEKPCYSMEEIQQMIDEKQSVRGKVICAINDAIQFDFNKSVIKRNSFAYLDSLAKLLIKVNANIRICGHTDNVGSAEYNKKLSLERAEAVRSYLIKKGVNKNMVTAFGFGMDEPRTSNDSEEGRALNRRVEFEIDN